MRVRGEGREVKGREGGGRGAGGREEDGPQEYVNTTSLYSEHSCGSTHIKESCQFGYIFHYSSSTFWLIAIYLGNHGGKKSSLFFLNEWVNDIQFLVFFNQLIFFPTSKLIMAKKKAVKGTQELSGISSHECSYNDPVSSYTPLFHVLGAS